MSEWWTYTLSDFLLFSPRTYRRLFELYNADVWPAQVLALAGGVAIAILLWRGGPRSSRRVTALLAIAWAWVAWAFLWQRYATINWAATYMAATFAVQALLLVAIGVLGHTLAVRERRSAPARVGLAMLAVAVLVHPLIGTLAGRDIATAEVFGLAPDPTALATLGALVLMPGRLRWLLLPIPLAWCAVSGAALWTMASPEWWLLPVAALLSAGIALSRSADSR